MRVLVCDDEKYVREVTVHAVKEAFPETEIFDTGDTGEVLEYVKHSKPDVALLDIEMGVMNGITLAKEIMKISPNTDIVFVTAYSKYAVEAFSIFASGYLLKPIIPEDIEKVFKNLRKTIIVDESKLIVRCFGKFEVFYRGQPLAFGRSRAKELFAYLVDLRGASANTEELCAVLWEDSTEILRNKHYLRNIVGDLKKTLKAIDMEDVFVTSRNSFSINPDKLDCDFYHYLEDDSYKKTEYTGDYMKQYSWAEFSFRR